MADETVQGGNINTAFQGIKKDELPDGSFAFVFSQSKGSKTFAVLAPDDSPPLLILAANPDRKTALIVNAGAVAVEIHNEGDFEFGDGIPLLPNGVGFYEDNYSTDAWYAITESGTASLRVMEIA